MRLENKNWDYHLKNRDKKYDLQMNLINSNINNGSNYLLLILSNLYKKIPDWVKLILKLLMGIYIILK